MADFKRLNVFRPIRTAYPPRVPLIKKWLLLEQQRERRDEEPIESSDLFGLLDADSNALFDADGYRLMVKG